MSKKERAEQASEGLQDGYSGSTEVNYGFAREIPIPEKEEVVNPPVTHTVITENE